MMNKKSLARSRKHRRIRAKVSGSAQKPRLVVYRSLRATYAQAVDDTTGRVMAQSSDLTGTRTAKPMDRAREVGKAIGTILVEQKITHIVFDRAGYQYHGRVRAVAEGARESGLQF